MSAKSFKLKCTIERAIQASLHWGRDAAVVLLEGEPRFCHADNVHLMDNPTVLGYARRGFYMPE